MLYFKYLYLVPFLIESIYENLINIKYIKKAKFKLTQFKPKIIAITGSYGKTSTKNYLYSIIGKYYKTLVTPKSYNTLLGITSFINKELNEKYDYLILEVGVDNKKGMNKFLKLFTPDISVVTGIAPQHMTTFKSLDNIAKEKMKLALACKDVAFINKDFELLKKYKKQEFRYFSKDEINVINNGFIYENDEYKTKLFGNHLYINLLIAIKISLYLGIPKNIIKKQIENIKNTEHRFEPIYLENTLVIDDSYNSNFYSFNKAIDSVSQIDKYRILITPGLIELGDDYYKLNFEIAKRCLRVFDKILLVGDNFVFKEIEKSTNKIETFSSFKDAYNNALKYEFDKVILIENDLPDIFLK
jgi:UDP-N-acetylmuramoyl-tripeptide--D-alanyl-D-alanine ligase